MQLLWRSLMPVSVKNRNKLTESLRTLNHSKLASQNWRQAERMLTHPLSWSSTRIRRVCRSTLVAEAYALSNAVDNGLRTRAAIVDMRGQLNFRQREETASAAMGHVWCTDCESIFALLVPPDTKQVHNKRLSIDWSALKQLIWDNRDDL